MTVQHAFRVTNPDIIQAFRDAEAAVRAHVDAVVADVKAVHPDATVWGTRGFGGGFHPSGIVGQPIPYEDRKIMDDEGRWTLKMRDDRRLDPVPDGWVWVESRDCYRPRRGRVGRPAQDVMDRLLADPEPEDGTNAAVKAAGLPTLVMVGNRMFWPGAQLWDGVLWIGYGVRLDSYDRDRDGDRREVRYDPENLPDGVVEAKLSKFHAAQEAEQERRDAEAGA